MYLNVPNFNILHTNLHENKYLFYYGTLIHKRYYNKINILLHNIITLLIIYPQYHRDFKHLYIHIIKNV